MTFIIRSYLLANTWEQIATFYLYVVTAPDRQVEFYRIQADNRGGPVAIYSSNVERMRFEEMRTDFICQFFRWKLPMDATEFADSKTLALFCPIVQYVLHRMLTLKRYLASLYQ